MGDLEETGQKDVFVSYARADAQRFAIRLAGDLSKHGYQVFVDIDDIASGERWEVRLENAIRSTKVVVAAMSHSSVAEDSVCRNEILFALNENKPVVPLRLTSDVRPSLMLCALNWIDFANQYEQGLSRLLNYLDGNASALRTASTMQVTGVTRMDFSVEIASHLNGFVGREWINAELETWLRSEWSRALVIVGEMGIGKSAIAAWLGATRKDVVAVHFCTDRKSESLDPKIFVANLVGQLSARLSGYANLVNARQPERGRATASDAFRELIIEPTTAIDFGRTLTPLLIVIDSLDEGARQQGETIVDVLQMQAKNLPAWLRIVATTRPEPSILDRIRVLTLYELSADRSENRRDVREYIRRRLASQECPVEVRDKIAHVEPKLERLANGNFQYARSVLDALEDRSLSVSDLGDLSSELVTIYGTLFRTRFSDLAIYDAKYGPLLGSLAVARAPLSTQLLQEVSGQSATTLNRSLRALRAYLRRTGSGQSATYELFHQSLRDWLVDAEASGDYWRPPDECHIAIANVLAHSWTQDLYSLSNYPAHLAGGRKWLAVGELLLNQEFVNTKIERLGYGTLASDFQWLDNCLNEMENPRDKVVFHRLASVVGELSGFGGRASEAEFVEHWLAESHSRQLLVTGPPGSGKTTFLKSVWVRGFRERVLVLLSVRHSSGDPLRHILETVSAYIGVAPMSGAPVRWEHIFRVVESAGLRLCIIVDGLDESRVPIEPPGPIPPQLCFIWGSRVMPGLRQWSDCQRLELQNMTLTETASILRGALGEIEKELPNVVIERLYAASKGSPLLLRIFIDEIKEGRVGPQDVLSGEWPPEKLDLGNVYEKELGRLVKVDRNFEGILKELTRMFIESPEVDWKFIQNRCRLEATHLEAMRSCKLFSVSNTGTKLQLRPVHLSVLHFLGERYGL